MPGLTVKDISVEMPKFSLYDQSKKRDFEIMHQSQVKQSEINRVQDLQKGDDKSGYGYFISQIFEALKQDSAFNQKIESKKKEEKVIRQ